MSLVTSADRSCRTSSFQHARLRQERPSSSMPDKEPCSAQASRVPRSVQIFRYHTKAAQGTSQNRDSIANMAKS